MKRVLFLSLILSLSALCCWADDDNTRVTNYYVWMTVHGDNSYDVSEEITAHFDTPHHGIYRYVPMKYYVGDDGHHVDVTDIDVHDNPYTLDEENQNVLIKIGDPDEEITGDRTYEIDYRLTNYDDRNDSIDLFYHSILGSDFQLPIDTLSFAIVFEKGLPKDAEKNLEAYSGEFSYKGNTLNLEPIIEGDTIFGTVTNISEENAVTLYLPLEEGYFTGEKTVSPTLAYIFLGITVLLLVVIFLYEMTVRHPSITKQIEFYPPEGMCSAEVGTIIDETVDDVDLASLIPWYASQGYITIKEIEKGRFIKDSYLELHKLKDASRTWKDYQQTFFDALFPDGKNVARLDDMPDVTDEIKETKEQLEGLYKDDTKLTHTHWAIWLQVPLWIVSTLFFVAAMPCPFFSDDDYLLIFMIWSFPYALGFFSNTTGASGRLFTSEWKNMFWFWIRFILMLVCLASQMFMLDKPIVDEMVIVAVYIACFMSVEWCTKLIVNSDYRAALAGKLLGLKEFIETAEEPRLKTLMESDSQYFYKILPYAMVFGISDVWADQFKNIEIEKPDWFDSATDAFVINGFVSTLTASTDCAITTMSPSSSGDSDGGGFSGGGSGGGGGGAW